MDEKNDVDVDAGDHTRPRRAWQVHAGIRWSVQGQSHTSRFFKVTFCSPGLRSLRPGNGHSYRDSTKVALKKLVLRAWGQSSHVYSFRRTNLRHPVAVRTRPSSHGWLINPWCSNKMHPPTNRIISGIFRDNPNAWFCGTCPPSSFTLDKHINYKHQTS